MAWIVEFVDEFEPEFDAFPEAVQDELMAQAKVIERFGPEAKRPRVDTLSGSKHANMKELRFDAADGVWRIAFAFDPRRRAVLRRQIGRQRAALLQATHRDCGTAV